MQDPQEMPAEQQVANPLETTNTQAANTEQVLNNGEQQVPAQVQQTSAQAYPSSNGRVAELEAQLAQARREAADNWSKYLRERADVDNIRKRQERLVVDRV